MAPHAVALPHVKTAPAIACRAGQWKVADGTVAKPVGGAKGGRAGLGFPEEHLQSSEASRTEPSYGHGSKPTKVPYLGG